MTPDFADVDSTGLKIIGITSRRPRWDSNAPFLFLHPHLVESVWYVYHRPPAILKFVSSQSEDLSTLSTLSVSWLWSNLSAADTWLCTFDTPGRQLYYAPIEANKEHRS